MDQLQGFILQRRSTGESDQDIASELLGAGWDREVVRSALAAVGANPNQPNQAYGQPAQLQQPQQQVQQQYQNPYQQQVNQVQGQQGYPQQFSGQPPAITGQPSLYGPQASNKLLFIVLGVLAGLLIVGGLVVLLLNTGGGSSSNRSTNTSQPSSSNSVAQQGSTIPQSGTTAEQSQRDSVRQSDALRLIAAAEIYAAQNQGRPPNADGEGINILTVDLDPFNDPLSEQPYEFTSTEPLVGQIQFANRVVCNGDTLVVGTASTVTIRIALESGELYCTDNS
jgi:hypothetical protein